MLIDDVIGDDGLGGGIRGDKFSRELMFLDSLNKKRIQVWINSPGGDCKDGEQIFASMLKSKTQVDTCNIGMAASIAGPIFLAGCKREMMSNAKFMMHPVSGGDDKSRKAYEDSVKTMISQRSVLSPEKTQELITATTWLNAEDCKKLGICTDIENLDEMNLPQVEESTLTSMHLQYGKIVNQLITDKKIKPMIKVTNKLGLNASANEDAILAGIEAIEAKNRYTSDELSKAQDELSKAQDRAQDLQAKFDAMKAEFDKAQDSIANVAKEKIKIEAKDVIANAVKLGKIENKADVIEKWEAKAIANLTDIKDALELIPAKNPGAKFPEVTNTLTPKSYTAEDINFSLIKKHTNKN